MSAFTVEKLSPTFGGQVKNLDLTKVSDYKPLLQPLQDALLEHKVLFFRNQQITATQLRQIAGLFGDLHIHPFYPTVENVPEVVILDTHGDNLPDSDTWHSDVSCIPTPPLGAFLSAQLLPEYGGDTLWTDCGAAYAALSAPLKILLNSLTAKHDLTKAFPETRFSAIEQAHWREAVKNNQPAIHPVIRSHPETGQKGLFVNEGFTTAIVELAPKESEAILKYLFEYVSLPEFTIRWRWQQYDLVFWDNRITQHYATTNYLPNRRVMHRATILGDRPRFF